MKKKFMLIFMVMLLMVASIGGCGSKKSDETKALAGTMLEKKDFMFTLQDSNGNYYGFNFDVKPENYDEFDNGDVVKVTYTGTITEVDPFDGEIISIEKFQR